MASSDDEEELVLQSVTNYYFVDMKNEPLSFAVLPIHFENEEKPDSPKEQVYLHGSGDGGLQKVYMQVTSWKLGLEDAQPEVTVRTKDDKWIKLLKPRKSYEDTIRTILITVELLHFLKKKPESSEKSLLDHLHKTFSSLENIPSVNDLLGRYPRVKLLVEKDDALARCQLLQALLNEQPRKKSSDEEFENSSTIEKSFIVEDDVMEEMGDNDGDESEEEQESDLFDSVCAICDNGGTLLCCEGRCMRSFHATVKDGKHSDCASLGLNKAEVEAIQNFLCKNCKYKKHQCFACGKLGSSDRSVAAEVFPCVNATCGHFYHPKCVADLLFKENEEEATEFQKKIAAGESFTCPVHKCYVCKQGEDKDVKELQFAVCRRCPKSYHRKCLPRKIAFDDDEEEEEQRAWDDLLPHHRILIYCLKHKLDEDLGTPIRNHIIFPEMHVRKKVLNVQGIKVKELVKKRKLSKNLPHDQSSSKPKKSTEKLSSSEERQPVIRRSISQQVSNLRKQLKPVKVSSEFELYKSDDDSVPMDSKKPLKEKANSAVTDVYSPSTGKLITSSYPKIDVETENKMSAIINDASSSVRLVDILKKRSMQAAHASGRSIDRTITRGKVEGFVEAVRAALKKLEDGGVVADAKAICESGILMELNKWNSKLKVYLAPVIHGTRYTSFGRHFTKVPKLIEIADKLQWYVQDGDTIVDFCCGSNDFSIIMKEKLDAAGKRNCQYKNYDLFPPKNDFNFERRNWYSVKAHELPTGSKLIMGLNPPFGVNGAKANEFIDKALTFRPKLIILIVPPETERLDGKKPPYQLIWEDSEKLSGKSFYLPGSVDVNDMQIEQWNNTPPPLYLWSRPDWSSKHREVALKHGHISEVQIEPCAEEENQSQTAGAKESPKETTGSETEALKVVVEKTQKEITEWHRIKDSVIQDDIIKEGNNIKNSRKIAEDNRKRGSPENNQKSRARKRRRGKEKGQADAEANQRNVTELSDMSISPPDTRHSNSQPPSEKEAFQASMEKPSEVRPLAFRTTPVGGRATTAVPDVDDIAMRYATPSNKDSYIAGSSYNQPSDRMNYVVHSSEERFSTYSNAYSNVDTLGRNYMDSYGRSMDSDARMPTSRAYGFEGRDDHLHRGKFPLGSSDSNLGHSSMYLPAVPYGLSGLNDTSVTQRYAPRLDEPNSLPGPGNPGLGVPRGRSDDFNMHGLLGFSPRGYQPGSGGYQPGSGGWRDE